MKNLKNLRKDLGLTQSEFSELLQISRSRLAMVECGKRELDAATLIRLADVEEFISRKQNVRDIENISVPKDSVIEQKLHELYSKRIRTSLRLTRLKKKLEKQKAVYA